MRLIERLQDYLVYSNISAYAFERACDLSNGYLGKQLKGKGSVGSDILEKIKEQYPDLSLVWLVTGKGTMLLSAPVNGSLGRQQPMTELNEEQQTYFASKDDVIRLLNRQLERMETMLVDKDKIIWLLEEQVRQLSQSAYKRVR